MKKKLLFIEGHYTKNELVKISYLEYDIVLNMLIAEGLYKINKDNLKLINALKEGVVVGYNLERMLNDLSDRLEIEVIDYLDLELMAYKYLDKLEHFSYQTLVNYYGIYNPIDKYQRDSNLVNLRLFKALVKDFKIDTSKWLLTKKYQVKRLRNDYQDIIDKLKHHLVLSEKDQLNIKEILKASNDQELMIKSLVLIKLANLLKDIKPNHQLKLSDELKLKLYLEEERHYLEPDIILVLEMILSKGVYTSLQESSIYQSIKTKTLLK